MIITLITNTEHSCILASGLEHVGRTVLTLSC